MNQQDLAIVHESAVAAFTEVLVKLTDVSRELTRQCKALGDAKEINVASDVYVADGQLCKVIAEIRRLRNVIEARGLLLYPEGH